MAFDVGSDPAESLGYGKMEYLAEGTDHRGRLCPDMYIGLELRRTACHSVYGT